MLYVFSEAIPKSISCNEYWSLKFIIFYLDSFKNSTTQKTDLRELIPEFFYLPEMFLNINKLNMGQKENKELVDDVFTPCNNNPYDFVLTLREVLEGDTVSMNIQKWIDLIFGYTADSSFYPLAIFRTVRQLKMRTMSSSLWHMRTMWIFLQSPTLRTRKVSLFKLLNLVSVPLNSSLRHIYLLFLQEVLVFTFIHLPPSCSHLSIITFLLLCSSDSRNINEWRHRVYLLSLSHEPLLLHWS